ncbi:MAG: hypothetical protein E6R03_01635 [Hyphomicrobiaceae bacterium]|nr:MAG: hypothetical protein E6R03_01635 [Hyphomicrobiaceae bacterium]
MRTTTERSAQAARAQTDFERNALITAADQDLWTTLDEKLREGTRAANSRNPAVSYRVACELLAYLWLLEVPDEILDRARTWVDASYCYMGKPLFRWIIEVCKRGLSWQSLDNGQWAHTMICAPVPMRAALDLACAQDRLP